MKVEKSLAWSQDVSPPLEETHVAASKSKGQYSVQGPAPEDFLAATVKRGSRRFFADKR